jgi:hypothetical protein
LGDRSVQHSKLISLQEQHAFQTLLPLVRQHSQQLRIKKQ